jgi:hypothetical protein
VEAAIKRSLSSTSFVQISKTFHYFLFFTTLFNLSRSSSNINCTVLGSVQITECVNAVHIKPMSIYEYFIQGYYIGHLSAILVSLMLWGLRHIQLRHQRQLRCEIIYNNPTWNPWVFIRFLPVWCKSIKRNNATLINNFFTHGITDPVNMFIVYCR